MNESVNVNTHYVLSQSGVSERNHQGRQATTSGKGQAANIIKALTFLPLRASQDQHVEEKGKNTAWLTLVKNFANMN